MEVRQTDRQTVVIYGHGALPRYVILGRFDARGASVWERLRPAALGLSLRYVTHVRKHVDVISVGGKQFLENVKTQFCE